MAFKDQQNLSKVEILFYKSNGYFLELRTCLNILIRILQVSTIVKGFSNQVPEIRCACANGCSYKGKLYTNMKPNVHLVSVNYLVGLPRNSVVRSTVSVLT